MQESVGDNAYLSASQTAILEKKGVTEVNLLNC